MGILQWLGFAPQRFAIETPLSGDDCVERLKQNLETGLLGAFTLTGGEQLIGQTSGRTFTVKRHRKELFRNDLQSVASFTVPEGAGPTRLELSAMMPSHVILFWSVFVAGATAVAGIPAARAGYPMALVAMPFLGLMILVFGRLPANAGVTVDTLCGILEARRVA